VYSAIWPIPHNRVFTPDKLPILNYV
jgi:hypothetical protein